MMDLSVTLNSGLRPLKLKNPVLSASGTFGYGEEVFQLKQFHILLHLIRKTL